MKLFYEASTQKSLNEKSLLINMKMKASMCVYSYRKTIYIFPHRKSVDMSYTNYAIF